MKSERFLVPTKNDILNSTKTMEKRTNKYKLTLEQLSTAKAGEETQEPLQLEFDNHDNIFTIIERLKQKDLFNDQNQATEFAIGLKIFSEVMIKNRQHPLFEELLPAFQIFMKKLKAL